VRPASPIRLHEVGGRHVVLVDHHDDLARVGDEELVDVVEAVGERRGPELAEAVAEVHPALALAAEADPGAQAQRRGERVRAHPVLPDHLAPLLRARGAGQVSRWLLQLMPA
jgi:hypothetical protein